MMGVREEWEGNLEITSHPVDQKQWVRVWSTTPKKWVELWLAAVLPCRAPIGRLSPLLCLITSPSCWRTHFLYLSNPPSVSFLPILLWAQQRGVLCNPIKNIIEMNEAQQRSTSCLKLHYWDIDIIHVSIRIPKVLKIFWSNKKNECNSEITQYYYMLERRMVLWEWHRGEQQSFQYWMSRCR